MNRTAEHEEKLSLITQARDFWMVNRLRYQRIAWISIGLTALGAFIYFLHLNVVRG